MNRVDKLLLQMDTVETAWLRGLAGTGPVALLEAEVAGFVETKRERPGGFGSRASMDHRITITETGKRRRAELLIARDQLGTKIAAARSAQMGSCIVCGAAARQGPYGTWRCNDDDCIVSKIDVPEQYWLALQAAVNRREEDYEEQLEYAEQHGHNCRCRECYVG
ncbi:hypothetical protein LCGC14_0909450 [marine sediment metagenome]|uniref:Uncharacterized protein n=1 Tax=marine sediment metagenome TaxID=412755 RepID=A0A0F9S0Y3_9ZZZZ